MRWPSAVAAQVGCSSCVAADPGMDLGDVLYRRRAEKEGDRCQAAEARRPCSTLDELTAGFFGRGFPACANGIRASLLQQVLDSVILCILVSEDMHLLEVDCPTEMVAAGLAGFDFRTFANGET